MGRAPRKPARPNLLERVIGAVAPETALRRFKARQILSAVTTGYGVKRDGASDRGTMGNWKVKRLSRWNEQLERETLTDRTEDLAANNPHAASTCKALPLNAVGTGLNPQAKPNYKRLGITKEQADEVGNQAEWVFSQWSREADLGGRMFFNDIQFLAVYRFGVVGEYLCLPLMRKEPGECGLKLALQMVDPRRMYTPYDLAGEPNLRDGILLDANGAAKTHYIANPDNGLYSPTLSSKDFKAFPARRGHRPGVLHGFLQEHEDQVRGVSVLAPAIKSFKDLGDYFDFHLVGAIMASSFPVWIDTSSPYDYASQFGAARDDAATTESFSKRYSEFEPSMVVGGQGKPHMLAPGFPSDSFPTFVEAMLRAVSAAANLPYEVVSKDFSKTNYSSARAALLEAWRVYMLYRRWLVNHLCRPVWDMVIEEAWLRGMITLPKGAPDFYDARAEWCDCTWIGPAKGHVDPVKEIEASIRGMQSNIFTHADVIAETGNDWEAVFEQRGRERRKQLDEEILEEALPPAEIVDDKDGDDAD